MKSSGSRFFKWLRGEILSGGRRGIVCVCVHVCAYRYCIRGVQGLSLFSFMSVYSKTEHSSVVTGVSL